MTPVSEISFECGRGAPLTEVPDGCEAARVARVDRGQLTVLTAAEERRVHVGGALHGDA